MNGSEAKRKLKPPSASAAVNNNIKYSCLRPSKLFLFIFEVCSSLNQPISSCDNGIYIAEEEKKTFRCMLCRVKRKQSCYTSAYIAGIVKWGRRRLCKDLLLILSSHSTLHWLIFAIISTEATSARCFQLTYSVKSRLNVSLRRDLRQVNKMSWFIRRFA